MPLFKRGPDRPEAPARTGGPEAVYARVIDGEHLWLAVRGEGPLTLRRDGAAELEVPAELAGDAVGPLLTARFPIAAALADEEARELELRLFAGDQPARLAVPASDGPGLVEPLTHDRRWQFRVQPADGDVLVRRTAVPRTIDVLALAATDDAVEILLNTEAELVELLVDGEAIAELPIDDSVVRVAALPMLGAGATATFQVRGADVVRSRNVLDRPMAAVALPPLPEADVTLRWTPEARLAVRRGEGS
jgi:hypothetical protein